MIQVTGPLIFGKLMSDPRFANQPSALIEVQKPLIFKIPDLLQDLLSESLTYYILCEAKLRFMRAGLEMEIPKKFIMAQPTSYFLTSQHQAAEAEKHQEVKARVFANQEEKITAVMAKLKNDPTGDHFTMVFKSKMNFSSYVSYSLGGFSLANLLLVQPALIVYP